MLEAEALKASVPAARFLQQVLADGHVIYGVNTGFGGSAGTRTGATEDLQRLLMRGLHYGVMSEPPEGSGLLESELDAPCMPESWARAAMAIRLNSLVSGSSGVRIETLRCLESLLNNDIVPRIPIRGSISASGDLSPLSYIGGAMQGKSSISVLYGDRSRGDRFVTSAHMALQAAKIPPVDFKAKEGLAITNGTAASAAVAALALHEVVFLYGISQILTAMSVEALRGTDESFDPYFSHVRPHPGQRESAHLVLNFLEGSKFVVRDANLEEASLRQDRYSIRTASQWAGPVAEDLLLAHNQIATEIDSVTDNPLIDVAQSRVLHGGNFQAKSVTVACDKLRVILQTLGRMLSVQCTEMINPATNRGLPPNLVADEPSQSFIWKGTDILAAALTSELGFLANPVGTHVQTAEMGNQALNSLALISARYTHESVACLTQLAAAHLVALCQAVDLRSMHARFLDAFQPSFVAATERAFPAGTACTADGLVSRLWRAFCKGLESTTSIDSTRRFTVCMEALQMEVLRDIPVDCIEPTRLREWVHENAERAREDYLVQLGLVTSHPDATPFLGRASRRLYTFVRKELHIPFVREATISTPDPEGDGGPDVPPSVSGRKGSKMGDFITKVYDSMRKGAMHAVIADIYAEVPDAIY